MLEDLGRAYERLERDDNLRAGVLYAEGVNFTAGLDLAEIGPRLMEGTLDWPADARNPWRNDGRGNAVRWLLTGDEFDAAEALRIGLVQEGA